MNKTVLTLVGLLLALNGPARADDVADFYKGKTVRIVVGVGVGSGYDINARALARYIGKHLPGNPTVIVQNQPGAGSLTATNGVYGVLPQDGSVIGGMEAGVLFDQIIGNPNARFETTKFQWLGSLSDEVGVVFTWQTSKVRTFDDLFGQ